MTVVLFPRIPANMSRPLQGNYRKFNQLKTMIPERRRHWGFSKGRGDGSGNSSAKEISSEHHDTMEC
jgi:hypothetical protein